MQYLVYQVECCPSTQKFHLQMYVQYKAQVAFTTVQKQFPGAHIEAAKGSDIDNHAYCTKEDTRVDGPWEFGERKAQGARTDLYTAIEILKAGGMKRLRQEAPEIIARHGRNMKDLADGFLKDSLPTHRTWMTEGVWYHGKTGVGKSHTAFDGYDPATHYQWKLKDKGWQDGYTGQAIVIINDFRGEIAYNDMLQMIDIWPWEVSRRGMEPMQFLARKVIITSSLPPDKVYYRRADEDDIAQLLDRLTVIEITGPNRRRRVETDENKM